MRQGITQCCKRFWTAAGVRTLGLLAAILCWLAAGEPALAGTFMEYLYVEANEGDSSGGHVALRLGDETFHFQHESPGILRLQRTPSAGFLYAYAMLGNRSIRESRIAVSDETYAILRGAFVRLQLVQGAQLEIRDALHKDVLLFDRLRRQSAVPLPVSGLGYFLPDEGSTPSPTGATSPLLISLRDRIRATYGDSFISERLARARRDLQGLKLTAAGKPVARLSRDEFPPYVATASTRYDEILHALFALQLLQQAPALREGACWRNDADAFRLAPEDVLALRKFAAQLESDLVGLVNSSRGDWGFPFMVGMARLAAIEASLSSGKLVLLDIFPPDSHLPPRQERALRPYLPKVAKDLREVFLGKRRKFFATGEFREGDYAVMERSGNLLLDVERSISTGKPLRSTPESTFPSREAKVGGPLPPDLEPAALEREYAAAQAAERDYNQQLDRLYSYDLLRRNCVTELFAVINRTLARQAAAGHEPGAPVAPSADAAARIESEKRLGGYLDATRGLTFIPIVSAGAVEKSYAVVESRELPSYRAARVAEMKKHEGAFKVLLRESNTLTSTVYRPGPDDSAFIFFTDDQPLLRPVFGAFNLMAGLGESLLGVLTMPVSGPERFISGARGTLFSLPELVFVNLRKGSMAYVEQPASR